MKKEFIIYRMTNKLNNKKYIGQTTNYNNRMKSYEKEIRRKNCNRPIVSALRKYGFENFNIEIIDDTAKTLDELDELEIYYIEKEKSLVFEWGYNIQTGGRKGFYDNVIKMKIDKLKIICLNDGKVFENIFEVVDYYGVKYSSVLDTCAGRTVFTKENKTFRYIDYNNNIKNNKTPIEIKQIQYDLIDDKFKYLFIQIIQNKILDIMTGKIYNTLEDVAYDFNEEDKFKIKSTLSDFEYVAKTYKGHMFFYLDEDDNIIKRNDNLLDHYVYNNVLPEYKYLVECKDKDYMYLDILTDEVYYTLEEISEKENISRYSIERQINGERYSFENKIFLKLYKGEIIPPKNLIITSETLYNKVDSKYKQYLKINDGIHHSSVRVINLMTGDIYNSLTDAAKELKINKTNISRCCKGKNKTSCGYVFRYIDDDNNVIPSDIRVTLNKKIYDSILPQYRYLVDVGKRKQPRQVRLIDVTTGKSYDSIKDASIELNIDDTSITKCIKGYQTMAYDKIFFKLDKDNNIINTIPRKVLSNIEYEKVLPEYRYLVDKIENIEFNDISKRALSNKSQRIIEITSGKVFNNYTKASEFFDISRDCVMLCSNDKRNSTSDLVFFKCDENDNILKNSKIKPLEIEVYKRVLPKYKEFVKIDEDIMNIIDITTGKIYKNTNEIKKDLNINQNKITSMLNGRQVYTDKNRIFRKINYKGEIQNVSPIKEVPQSIYDNILPEYRCLVKLKS